MAQAHGLERTGHWPVPYAVLRHGQVLTARFLHIRAARATDLDPIARVRAAAVVAAAYYEEAVDEEDERRRFLPRVRGYLDGTYHPRFARAERTVIVAERGEVIGFAAGHASTRLGCTGELQWLFTHPEWQRRGSGAALLRAMAEWFARAQATRVIVDAPPANPYRAFYVRHGAVPLDEHWLHWPDIRDLRPA